MKAEVLTYMIAILIVMMKRKLLNRYSDGERKAVIERKSFLPVMLSEVEGKKIGVKARIKLNSAM